MSSCHRFLFSSPCPVSQTDVVLFFFAPRVINQTVNTIPTKLGCRNDRLRLYTQDIQVVKVVLFWWASNPPLTHPCCAPYLRLVGTGRPQTRQQRGGATRLSQSHWAPLWSSAYISVPLGLDRPTDKQLSLWLLTGFRLVLGPGRLDPFMQPTKPTRHQRFLQWPLSLRHRSDDRWDWLVILLMVADHLQTTLRCLTKKSDWKGLRSPHWNLITAIRSDDRLLLPDPIYALCPYSCSRVNNALVPMSSLYYPFLTESNQVAKWNSLDSISSFWRWPYPPPSSLA